MTKGIILALKLPWKVTKMPQQIQTMMRRQTDCKNVFSNWLQYLKLQAVFYLGINYACYFTRGLDDSCFIYFFNVFLKCNKHSFLADKKLKAVKYISRILKEIPLFVADLFHYICKVPSAKEHLCGFSCRLFSNMTCTFPYMVYTFLNMDWKRSHTGS